MFSVVTTVLHQHAAPSLALTWTPVAHFSTLLLFLEIVLLFWVPCVSTRVLGATGQLHKEASGNRGRIALHL